MLKAIVLFLLYFGSLTPFCFANVSVSVNPIDGSNTLRFERAPDMENKPELHIRISSSNGERFQVFQRVLEPMVNEKGDKAR